ncbi:MAG: SpoVA/SpoVAEb family sporulation membrane protein [Clostridia bacterium]|nr:SpoVA/SpoVAEb family sporulation membrane protein [Clostridia bacterium]
MFTLGLSICSLEHPTKEKRTNNKDSRIHIVLFIYHTSLYFIILRHRFIVNFFAKPVCPILTVAESNILGTAANMFKIAGPVIVYGTTSAFIYSVIYWITMLL